MAVKLFIPILIIHDQIGSCTILINLRTSCYRHVRIPANKANFDDSPVSRSSLGKLERPARSGPDIESKPEKYFEDAGTRTRDLST